MTRRRPRRQVVALAAVVVSSLLATGCGLKSAEQFTPAAEPGSIKPVPELEGVRIVVGSKDFTEQLILGKMAVILLRVAGADAVDQTGIAGSVATRQALLNGEIDATWDYTGTAWISYLGQTKPVPGRMAQWRAVRRADARNGVEWYPPAPLNNTYAFAVRAQTARRLGISELSDLAGVPREELTFCVDSEFASRDDGFEPMLDTYGVPLDDVVPRRNVRIMDAGVIYDATARGRCTFGEVFTTDGRIKALNLVVLEDDKGFFPNYNVAFNIRSDVARRYPQIRKVIEPVSAELTTEVMQDLNARVDVDGEDPGLVARDWLRSKGFVR